MELPPNPPGDKGFFTEGADAALGKRKADVLTDYDNAKAQRIASMLQSLNPIPPPTTPVPDMVRDAYAYDDHPLPALRAWSSKDRAKATQPSRARSGPPVTLTYPAPSQGQWPLGFSDWGTVDLQDSIDNRERQYQSS